MKTKKLTALVASVAVLANLLIAASAMAVADNTSDEVVVNQGVLDVRYTPTSQTVASFQVSPNNSTATDFIFGDVEFENTRGNNTTWSLSWTTQNLHSSTGVIVTHFSYLDALSFTTDENSSIFYVAGSSGSTVTALASTGTAFFFTGAGGSGSTSDSFDLVTGSGSDAGGAEPLFNLIGRVQPKLAVTYKGQYQGFYTGTLTFTIL